MDTLRENVGDGAKTKKTHDDGNIMRLLSFLILNPANIQIFRMATPWRNF